MKNKRLNSIIFKRIAFVALLFVATGATKAFSQSVFDDGILKYAIFDNTSNQASTIVLVTGLVDKNQPITDLIVPKSVNLNGKTLSVNWIMPYAFSGCANLISVIIPNTISSIAEGSFYNCTGLLSVTIPDAVIFIGKHAFYGCKSLTSVSIPKTVNIHEKAFEGCDGINIKRK